MSLTLLLVFRSGCLVQPPEQGFRLVLLDLVLSCVAVISWKPALFRRENGEWSWGNRESRELGGKEGGETEVRMFCVREESIF